MFCTDCGAHNEQKAKYCTSCGAALATAATTDIMQTGNAHTDGAHADSAANHLTAPNVASAAGSIDYTAAARMSHTRRMSRKQAIVCCCLLAFAAVLAGALLTLKFTVFSAQGPLKSYVSLLSRGEYGKATSMVDPGVPNASRTLLTDAFGSATTHRMEHVEIGDLQAAKDHSSAKQALVSYTIDGTKQTKTITLEPNGKRWLFFDSWNITTPLISSVSVAVPESDTEISVNGKTVNLAKVGMNPTAASIPENAGLSDDSIDVSAMKQYSLPTYPGQLSISLADSTYIESQTEKLSTPKDQAFLIPRAKEKLNSEILEQVNNHVDSCAASVAVSSPGCGFSDGDFGTWYSSAYTNIKRSITDRPTLDTLDVYNGTFTTDVIHTSISYQARVLDTDPWTDETTSDSGTISGSYTITRGKLKVTIAEDSSSSW
jgi:hypothetical protein